MLRGLSINPPSRPRVASYYAQESGKKAIFYPSVEHFLVRGAQRDGQAPPQEKIYRFHPFFAKFFDLVTFVALIGHSLLA